MGQRRKARLLVALSIGVALVVVLGHEELRTAYYSYRLRDDPEYLERCVQDPSRAAHEAIGRYVRTPAGLRVAVETVLRWIPSAPDDGWRTSDESLVALIGGGLLYGDLLARSGVQSGFLQPGDLEFGGALEALFEHLRSLRGATVKIDSRVITIISAREALDRVGCFFPVFDQGRVTSVETVIPPPKLEEHYPESEMRLLERGAAIHVGSGRPPAGARAGRSPIDPAPPPLSPAAPRPPRRARR